MAKKSEFKPDKPRSGWLSKLYITPKQRRALLKWALYSLLILVLSLLQDVVLSNVRPFGAAIELVPVAIILVCLLEGTQNGCIFALCASLYYWFSGATLGAFAMVVITVLSIFVTMFRQNFMQKGFGAAFLCAAGSVLIYDMLLFTLGAILGLTPWYRFLGFLLTASFGVVMIPVLYPLLLLIESIGGETWKE